MATGALGAVGQYSSQQQAAGAANAGRTANYEHQLKIRENNWRMSLSQDKNDKKNF